MAKLTPKPHPGHPLVASVSSRSRETGPCLPPAAALHSLALEAKLFMYDCPLSETVVRAPRALLSDWHWSGRVSEEMEEEMDRLWVCKDETLLLKPEAT